MRVVVVILLVIIVAIGLWWYFGQERNVVDAGSQQQPIAVSQHSDTFNNSVEDVMNTYYSLTEEFVNWDSTDVRTSAAQLKNKLESLQLQELPDSTGLRETASTFVDNAIRDAGKIESAADMTAARHALNSLTENIYNFLRVIQYDQQKLYLQECPMAFNDEDPGMWLSKSPDIRNPYLGTSHPRYGKGMLSCGETKETLNYTGQK